MEMATYRIQENTTHDSEYSLTAISYSCLLSLVIGIGDTGKILVAIATLIKCSKTLTSHNVKVSLKNQTSKNLQAGLVEYAQKYGVKSLPVTQGLLNLNTRTLHSYRKPHLKLHLPPLLFRFGLNF